jgi:tetratricopeptide (TPR) repeat protein
VAAEALTHRPDACPDPETLAAYLDARLTQDERERVTEHVADCDDCYFVVTEAAQMRAMPAEQIPAAETLEVESVSATIVKPKWWPSKSAVWSSAAGLAAAASLVLAIGTGTVTWRGNSSHLRALIAAVGADRTFEARLSGGFEYGPVRGPVRGSDGAPTSPDVRIAIASIEKEAVRRQTAQNLHELGAAYLVAGDVAHAIATLENTANRTNTATALSDLAAAYLVRGVRENRPQDLSRALAMATQAVQRDASMREALFNRALAFDHLSMFDDARQAWQAYLRADDQSGWAAEARIHLQRLGGDQRTP